MLCIHPLDVEGQQLGKYEPETDKVIIAILPDGRDINLIKKKFFDSVDQDFMMQLNGLSISLDEASTFYQQNMDVTSNFQAGMVSVYCCQGSCKCRQLENSNLQDTEQVIIIRHGFEMLLPVSYRTSMYTGI